MVMVWHAEHRAGETSARQRPARDYAARLADDVKKALTGGKKAEAAAAEAAAKVGDIFRCPCAYRSCSLLGLDSCASCLFLVLLLGYRAVERSRKLGVKLSFEL